jgi:hypothetical protein
MANWCTVDCVGTGPESDIERMKSATFVPKPEKDYNGIDFQRVVPMPEDLKVLPKPDALKEDRDRRMDWILTSVPLSVMAANRHTLKEPKDIETAWKILAEKEANGYDDATDWCRINWGTDRLPYESTYSEGHRFSLVTAGSSPIPVLVKIVEMFPSLSFTNIKIVGDVGYFMRGTISADGVDLVDDEEA